MPWTAAAAARAASRTRSCLDVTIHVDDRHLDAAGSTGRQSWAWRVRRAGPGARRTPPGRRRRRGRRRGRCTAGRGAGDPGRVRRARRRRRGGPPDRRRRRGRRDVPARRRRGRRLGPPLAPGPTIPGTPGDGALADAGLAGLDPGVYNTTPRRRPHGGASEPFYAPIADALAAAPASLAPTGIPSRASRTLRPSRSRASWPPPSEPALEPTR